MCRRIVCAARLSIATPVSELLNARPLPRQFLNLPRQRLRLTLQRRQVRLQALKVPAHRLIEETPATAP